MTNSRVALATACLAAALCIASVARAQAPAPIQKGEVMMGTASVAATVTKINHATREVTIKAEDGTETTFVADEAVKNLPQVQVGDTVTATYSEALVFEVNKGGEMVGPATTVAGGSAAAGARPAAAIARQTTATVLITAIDPKGPLVTFKGPRGNVRTIKVQHPEKLEGVSVGDTVQLTFTEALGIKVEETPKK
jgi:hypothetical protein